MLAGMIPLNLQELPAREPTTYHSPHRIKDLMPQWQARLKETTASQMSLGLCLDTSELEKRGKSLLKNLMVLVQCQQKTTKGAGQVLGKI